MEKMPNEFPSKEEQIKHLAKEKADITENLRLLGVDEKEVEDILRGFPVPEYLPNEVKEKIKEETEKLKGIKIRENFLKNKD